MTPRTLKQVRSFMSILIHIQNFLPHLQAYTEQLRPSLNMSDKQTLVWAQISQTDLRTQATSFLTSQICSIVTKRVNVSLAKF